MGIEEILAAKRDEVLRIAAKYGAHDVRVFGSVAKGEAGPGSDVDFVVRFEKGRSLIDQAHMIEELSELLNRPVDVASERGLSVYIRDRVLEEAIAI